MKNRKRIVVAFLLVAMLLISVGFAAVTNVLDIQGSITVSGTAASDAFNEDIYFTGVMYEDVLRPDGVVAGDNAGYTANINTNNNDKAQFTITGIKSPGDSMTITYQIINESEKAADVTLKTITNTNGITEGSDLTSTGDGDFDFDFYFGSVGTKTVRIAAGTTATVSVTVELLNQITDAVYGSSASFVIELNATSVD